MATDRNMISRIPIIGIALVALGAMLPLSGLLTSSTASDNSLALQGKVDMVLYDKSGDIKTERHIDNLIVDVGVEGVAYRIAPHDGLTSSAPYNYIALGTSNTAVDPTDDALSAELATGANYARKQDATAMYSTASGNQLILSVVFGPGEATGTLRESGIFNASTDGNILARQTFDDIQKATGDTLTITWTITFSPT